MLPPSPALLVEKAAGAPMKGNQADLGTPHGGVPPPLAMEMDGQTSALAPSKGRSLQERSKQGHWLGRGSQPLRSGRPIGELNRGVWRDSLAGRSLHCHDHVVEGVQPEEEGDHRQLRCRQESEPAPALRFPRNRGLTLGAP